MNVSKEFPALSVDRSVLTKAWTLSAPVTAIASVDLKVRKTFNLPAVPCVGITKSYSIIK